MTARWRPVGSAGHERSSDRPGPDAQDPAERARRASEEAAAYLARRRRQLRQLRDR